MPKTKKAQGDVLAGRSPEMQLLRAVRRYVEAHGGKIVVIGGVELQRLPDDPEGKYRLAVAFLGRKPDKGLTLSERRAEGGDDVH